MPLSPELAQWLCAEGHDAVHANELSMYRGSDAEILQAATNTSRAIITADLDFPRLLAPFGSAGPGLIPLRGGNYNEAEGRDCVRRVLMSIPQAELSKSIVVVDANESDDAGSLYNLTI